MGGVVGAVKGDEQGWLADREARDRGESLSGCFQALNTWECCLAVPSLSFLSSTFSFKIQCFSFPGSIPGLGTSVVTSVFPVPVCLLYRNVTSSSLIAPPLDCVLLEGRDCVRCCFHHFFVCSVSAMALFSRCQGTGLSGWVCAWMDGWTVGWSHDHVLSRML